MSGPGRFATPDKFEIVKKFLNPLTDLTSFQLVPGSYTKAMLWSAFGISPLEVDFSRRNVSIDQAQYDDGKDDFLERAYIWNTTAFAIKDGARFVVEMDGTRYIEDFAVVPFLNIGAKENFDFAAGSFFGNIANSLLEPKVDPSKIGRRVDFDFSTNRTVQPRFTFNDYVAASTSSSAAPSNPLLYAYIAANSTDFLDRFYNTGATKFLDIAGRFVAYDGAGANSLSPATFDNIAIDRNLRVALDTKGINMFGGAGADTLLGGVRDDVLNGGVGAGTLTGGTGADVLLGGQDYDTYFADSSDTITDSDGKGVVNLGGNQLGLAKRKKGEVEYKDGAGNSYVQSGSTLSINGGLNILNFSSGDLGIVLKEEDVEEIKKKVKKAETIPSPIILDLDGDGVETLAFASGAHFDHENDGMTEQTGWVGKDDGLLVRDLNGNAKIDSGAELFGDQTRLANGQKAANGFEALRELDSNQDGKVDASDGAYGSLRIWKDSNSDGRTDAGELLGLAEAGVQSINVEYAASTGLDPQGNDHRQRGSYTTTGGVSRTYGASRAQTFSAWKVQDRTTVARTPDA